MAIYDKTTTNKWAYERSYKSLNSYSLVEYNKIYLTQTLEKFCKKRVYGEALHEKSIDEPDYKKLIYTNMW